jgi:hypothetical protein
MLHQPAQVAGWQSGDSFQGALVLRPLPFLPLQAQLYTSLIKGAFLTGEERDVLRWGRNATGELDKGEADKLLLLG